MSKKETAYEPHDKHAEKETGEAHNKHAPKDDPESGDFEDWSVSELKAYAKENDIDLGDAKKKDDIIEAIDETEAEE